MSTNMWILTNGLNCGATAYICNAIEKETRQHKLKNFRKINKYPLLFGVSQETDLVYGSALKVIDQSQKAGFVSLLSFTNSTNQTISFFLVSPECGLCEEYWLCHQ